MNPHSFVPAAGSPGNLRHNRINGQFHQRTHSPHPPSRTRRRHRLHTPRIDHPNRGRRRPQSAARRQRSRAPLTPSAFFFLPLGSIRPRGWLLDQLRIQASGLSGHLYAIWPDVGPNSGWLGGTGESWERGPYYLDGLLPLAYLVNDARLKALAQRFVDWTLDHPWPNGMIGPAQTMTGGRASSCSKPSRNIRSSPATRASSRSWTATSAISLSLCPHARSATGASSVGRTTSSPSFGSTTAPARRICWNSPACSTSRVTTGSPTSPTSSTRNPAPPPSSSSRRVRASTIRSRYPRRQ